MVTISHNPSQTLGTSRRNESQTITRGGNVSAHFHYINFLCEVSRRRSGHLGKRIRVHLHLEKTCAAGRAQQINIGRNSLPDVGSLSARTPCNTLGQRRHQLRTRWVSLRRGDDAALEDTERIALSSFFLSSLSAQPHTFS